MRCRLEFGGKACIVAIAVLAVMVCGAFCYAQEEETPTIADSLGAVVEPGGVLAPVVSAADEKAAQALPEHPSLEQVAKAYGLGVFPKDKLTVLAPPQRVDVEEVMAGRVQPPRALGTLCNQLVCSLTEDQLRLAGSKDGLPFAKLTAEQKKLMAEICSGTTAAVVVEPGGNVNYDQVVPAADLDYRACKLIARLEAGMSMTPPGQGDRSRTGFGGYSRYGFGMRTERTAAGYVLADLAFRPADESSRGYGVVPEVWKPRMIANTLKPSDLDYTTSALNVVLGAEGRMTLSDLISKAAEKTGVKLYASPGSDEVELVLARTSDLDAGLLLKAASLATTGTWRKIGDAYVFTLDRSGIGQIAAKYRELQGRFYRDSQQVSDMAYDLLRNTDTLTVLPFDEQSPFKFTAEQLKTLKAAALDPSASQQLAWDALTPDQQKVMEEQFKQWEGRGFRAPDDRSTLRLTPSIQIKVTLAFPKPGMVLLSPEAYGGVQNVRLLPPSGSQSATERLAKDAPPGYSPPAGQLRGYLCKPSADESAESLVKTLGEHGFDMLYLKAFTDGHAALPSAQFPLMDGLDPEYLMKVITAAHNNGIKVFGVLDVLRWSDAGSLDRDVFGRTRSEWAKSRSLSNAEAAEEQFSYGEAFTGDAVNPTDPAVGEKLRGLLGELAPYKVDGLALDCTSMLPSGAYDTGGLYASGRPGYSDSARREFLAEFHADGLDVPAEVGRTGLEMLSLQPIVRACTGLSQEWEDLYRIGCDNLLDSLLRKWSDAGRESPVWVIDTLGVQRSSNDLTHFKGRIAGLILPSPAVSSRDERYANPDIAAIPLVRTSELAGTIRFADALAGLPQQTAGVVIDFTCAGKKKADYLKLIVP